MEDDTIDVEVITPSIDDLLHSIKGNETLDSGKTVSYTHLTLPTIYSV